jgi:import inner membrane translocase subunit TIM50
MSTNLMNQSNQRIREIIFNVKMQRYVVNSIIRHHCRMSLLSSSSSSMIAKKRFSSLITNESTKQPVGKGLEVAKKLGSRSTSFANPGTKRGGVDGLTIVLSLLLTGVVGSAAYLTLSEQGKEVLRQSNFPGASFIYENLIKPFAEPIRDKLLPDFPPFEPGQYIPKTLVIDFEDTLVHLEWDREYGWRAVKRPGVDQFLARAAASGYEIVLFSSGLYMFLEPFTVAIDPRGAISHRLFREATVFVGNKHVKDLSKLNRDLSHVIAVDDDPSAVEYQPENVVAVKPFVDKNDVTDTTLLDLVAMLEDFQMREVNEVRAELSRLRAKGHGDAIAGFKAEREERIRKADEAQHKGLGGMMRGLGRPQHSAAGAWPKQ